MPEENKLERGNASIPADCSASLDVCATCKHFDEGMWDSGDGRVWGTCYDDTKIIHPQGCVIDRDNAPAISDARVFTCFNHLPNVKFTRRG